MKRLVYLLAGILVGVGLTSVALAYSADGPIEAYVEYGKLLLQGLVETLKHLK